MLPGAEIVLQALYQLAADRPLSLGMSGVIYGCIPYPAIVAFATRNAIDNPDTFDRFIGILRTLDADEVRLINEKANKREP